MTSAAYEMKWCSQCGHSVELGIPPGDDRQRYICGQCHTIHYQNPRLIVGCLPLCGERVLLCRRAIEPRKGYWTLPAGFMENGETTLAGALRETWEEARARGEHAELYRVFDLPHINQVYMFYRATLVNGEFGVGPESSEAALFHEHEIPWRELAFPVVVETLREFFADRRCGSYPVRASGLDPSWGGWLQRAPDTHTDA
jgi:ADP-ribose pyrophosphatase YjhB (NUDIX family)